jgi:hypothetical protein
MLFNFHNGPVDIVREKPYTGVVTLRSSDREAVALFEDMTPCEVLKVPHHMYPWILHFNEGNLPSEIDLELFDKFEVVERLTPEPVAFAVECTYRDEYGKVVESYDYCWPQDIDIAHAKANYEHENVVESIKFLPLFKIPNKLLGIVDED